MLLTFLMWRCRLGSAIRGEHQARQKPTRGLAQEVDKPDHVRRRSQAAERGAAGNPVTV